MLEGILQPTHLLLIFFIALLVFRPKKLPELVKGHRQQHSRAEAGREISASRRQVFEHD
jgi:Sec-independent protein translocase protein TatA